MYLSLLFKKNDSNIYTKPFIIDFDDQYFNAEILKESDFSLIVEKNETIVFDLILLNDNVNFIDKIKHKKYKNLGTYNIKLNLYDSLYKINVIEKLDDKFKLEITFLAMQKNKKEFVLTNPSIKGLKTFL
jgi:hypothetical protein